MKIKPCNCDYEKMWNKLKKIVKCRLSLDLVEIGAIKDTILQIEKEFLK